MRSLRGLFPHVAARRTWNQDGTTGWEFRFTPRSASPRPAGRVPEPVLLDPEPPGFQVLPARAEAPVLLAVPEPARIVSSRGVQIGAHVLRIDEFRHRIEPAGLLTREPPALGLCELVPRPDIAGALVALAADPQSAWLHHRVVGRLALTHEWFAQASGLDIASARLSGRGTGRRLDGVFVWRAVAVTSTFTYLVAPTPAIKDLLAADLGLTRALIRAACPQPEDAFVDLEGSLREALTRLAAASAATGRPGPGSHGPTAGLVLEIDPDPELTEHLDRARPKSDTERALSEELADLARKVGTASVRNVDTAARGSRAG